MPVENCKEASVLFFFYFSFLQTFSFINSVIVDDTFLNKVMTPPEFL